MFLRGMSTSKPLPRFSVAQVDSAASAEPDERRNVVAKGMQRFETGKSAGPQPAWERLSDRVVSVLGQNPQPFTLNGTNCYIVGTGRRRILIDAGESPDGAAPGDLRGRDDYGYRLMLPILRECMREIGCDGFSHILVTHLHYDHFGGAEELLTDFPGPTVVGMLPMPSSHSALFCMREFERRGLLPYLEKGPLPFDPEKGPIPWYERASGPEYDNLPEWPDEDFSWDTWGRTKRELQADFYFIKEIADWYSRWESGDIPSLALRHGDVLHAEGATLKVLHTPGHAENHAAFALLEEGAIFSGDHVLGYGTTILHDLGDYMASLARLLETLQAGVAAPRHARLYPGHGPFIEDGVELLERYADHRQKREDQVLSVLQGAGSAARHTVAEIAEALYPATSPARMVLAQENIEKILLKLHVQGSALCLSASGCELHLQVKGYDLQLDKSYRWSRAP